MAVAIVGSLGAIPNASRPKLSGYREAMIAGNEKYVGAPATTAFETTMLFPARESRNGVTGRVYPWKPTWSARKQSTVTKIRERRLIERYGDTRKRIQRNPSN